MTGAILGNGVALKRGDGASPEVFTSIGEVVSHGGPNQTVNEVAVTHLGSTVHEYLTGLRDSGELTLEANYLGSDTQQNALETDMANGALRNFQMTFPFSPVRTAAFSGRVTAFGLAGGVDEPVRLSISIRITSLITWT
jgi:hypothetical protein